MNKQEALCALDIHKHFEKMYPGEEYRTPSILGKYFSKLSIQVKEPSNDDPMNQIVDVDWCVAGRKGTVTVSELIGVENYGTSQPLLEGICEQLHEQLEKSGIIRK